MEHLQQNDLKTQIELIKYMNFKVKCLLEQRFFPYKHAFHLSKLDNQFSQLTDVYKELVKHLQDASLDLSNEITIAYPNQFLNPRKIEQVVDISNTLQQMCEQVNADFTIEKKDATRVRDRPSYITCAICGSFETIVNITAAKSFALCGNCNKRFFALSMMEEKILQDYST